MKHVLGITGVIFILAGLAIGLYLYSEFYFGRLSDIAWGVAAGVAFGLPLIALSKMIEDAEGLRLQIHTMEICISNQTQAIAALEQRLTQATEKIILNERDDSHEQ